MIGLRAAWIVHAQRVPVDFLSFWAASRLALSGHPSAAYDVHLHHAAETMVAPIHGLLPFAYPPPYLLLVAPLGLASYPVAFVIWLLITAALYLLVTSRRRVDVLLAQPATLANFLVGQNGFVTTAILSGGLRLLAERPFVAGAVLGLMVIKPQLALVLPLAMIAGRQWKAIAGAFFSSACLLLVSLLAFGSGSYRAFAAGLPFFTGALAGHVWRWNELASLFGLLRYIGAQQDVAIATQLAVGVAAMAVTCRAWWLRKEEKAPLLAAATLLVSPYLFNYDTLLLAIPMLWLIERRRHGWAVAVSWMFCLLPVAGYFGLYAGPNTAPVAAILCIGALIVPSRNGPSSSAAFRRAEENAA